MNRIFTLKHYAILCLVLFCRITTFSQTCAGTPGTTCIAVTDQFATASFGNSSGDFSYETPASINQPTGDYILGGNTRGSKIITSYTLAIQNNVFSVGAQVTSGLGRISTVATIQVLNPGTNTVICQVPVTIQSNGCLSANFSGLAGVNVKINFVFNKTANGGTTFDNFGIDPEQTILPVTFAGFEGKRTENGTQLTWKVAGESNVNQYEVERSTTGTNGFVKIGSVPATGSSSYTFTDATVFSNTIIYRIKNVDKDGRFKYSTLLYFKNGTGSVMFRVLPTVITSKTTVEHSASSGNDVITLSTIDGKILRSIRPATGAVQTAVDMSGLRPGLYLLKWSDGNGNVEVAKVIKQ